MRNVPVKELIQMGQRAVKALVFDRPALGTFGPGRIKVDVVPLAILLGFAPVEGDADERGGVLLIVGRKSIAAWQFHVDGHVACSVVDAERLVA